jgi:hypothetical protein
LSEPWARGPSQSIGLFPAVAQVGKLVPARLGGEWKLYGFAEKGGDFWDVGPTARVSVGWVVVLGTLRKMVLPLACPRVRGA